MQIAPLIFNIVFPKQRDGAPVEVFYPREGLPICPYASGIPKTARNPNAARLFLDWYLSAEGQEYSIKQYGNFTLLASPPAVPPGFDPRLHKTWVPNYKQMEEVHGKWIAE